MSKFCKQYQNYVVCPLIAADEINYLLRLRILFLYHLKITRLKYIDFDNGFVTYPYLHQCFQVINKIYLLLTAAFLLCIFVNC